MIIRHGDMFTSTARALAHGVNVDGVMGAGVALGFRCKFPGLHRAYREACRSGQLQPGGLYPFLAPDGRWVYNIASQDRPGPRARLEWIISGAHLALEHADSNSIDLVAIPRIGSDIGGLDWADVSLALEEVEGWYDAAFEAWIFSPKRLGARR